MKYVIIVLMLFAAGFNAAVAQKAGKQPAMEQCGTMPRLERLFSRNPGLKARFNLQLERFNRTAVPAGARPLTPAGAAGVTGTTYIIPIVFHIVLADPTVVTDKQILSQLAILNQGFAGTTGDSIGIPAYFKSIFGRTNIQFCLAQRNPDGESSTGIDRVQTAKAAFSSGDDAVKHASSGGADIWDPGRYLNIWICSLSDNLLGYGTFPDDGQPQEQGVVIDSRSLPGGSFANFNQGKTLIHETGHFFNLYHIWGDDNGGCTGTDYVDDTPNQANYSSGCTNGLRTDNCTTDSNGILYQDYMDYSYDRCLLLFTRLQAERMESALLSYRASLTVSDACTPVITRALDLQLKSVEYPNARICSNNFAPRVTISNRGSQIITGATISALIDNGPTTSFAWTGSLASFATAAVTLDPLTVSEGRHKLTIYVRAPNAGADENTKNDTISATFQFYSPVTALDESFEGGTFPPPGWDIVNPDQSITWKKITGVGKTGNSSVMINNFDYSSLGEADYLRLPELSLQQIDSAYLSFQVAAATFTPAVNGGNNWDTLEVLLSKDCGITYSSIYKKWAGSLVTVDAEYTTAFAPGAKDWRKDSVNLTPYINAGPVMLAFRNITGYENNIYVDDVKLKTVVINPNLKARGFLVTPNPTTGLLSVQFYPNPVDLRSVQVYNLLGQKLAETTISSGSAGNSYRFDIGRYAAGTYLVRAVFGDRVIIQKVIKSTGR
jgi:hypothetical protein